MRKFQTKSFITLKVDFSDKQKQLISVVMGHHMGEKKVLIPAIEFLQNLVVTITPDDVLVKTVRASIYTSY